MLVSVTNVIENTEKYELLYIARGIINWSSYFEKQFDDI